MIKNISNKELLLHPLNIILIFIVNTSSQKIRAGLPAGIYEPIISLLVIIIFSLLAYFAFRKIVNEKIKAAILLSYTLLTILFFRDIIELIIYFGLSDLISYMGEYFIAITLTLLCFAFIIRWLSATNRRLIKMNSYLNLVTAIFLTMEIVSCSFAEVSKIRLKENLNIKASINKNINPDIYFILLDGYTGFNGLKKFWNFDNDKLKQFLKKNNFFIAENSRSVYNVTNYSMTSTFSMSELIFNKDDVHSKGNYLQLADYMKNNLVVKYLENLGYSFYNLTFWDINNESKFYEDIYFLRRGNIYQARTLYGHLYEIYNEKFADMAEINPQLFYDLAEIHTLSEEKPKFIYAHIPMPHPPYYFDEKGNRMDFKYSGDKKDMKKYLGQLKYTNKLLMNTIKNIMNTDKEPPVIIVQSDHGFRSYEGKDKLEMEFSVLNSFYFPDKDYSMLNDSLKTINTFRIIFNKYFSQNLSLLD